MKRICFIIITALLVTLFIVSTSSALRKGNSLISVGDTKIEVLAAFGQPLLMETIGSTEPYRGDDSIKLTVSEWTYGPWDGCYYVLTFKGSELVNIKSVRE